MAKSMVQIRPAMLTDINLLLTFIKHKAEFDRVTGSFSEVLQADEQGLAETLFNKTPFASVLFAEVADLTVGFALYYFRYSSFRARPSLWLDDLYVEEQERSHGVGSALLRRLAQIAQENHCWCLAWNAHVNNPRAVHFYQRMGAEIVDQYGDILTLQALPEVILQG